MSPALEGAFLELGRILLDQPLTTVLRRVADLAVDCVEGADDVSITVLRKGKPHTVAFHGELANDLDERQYSLGFGPCVAAAQAGQTLRIDDTADDDKFPDFSRLAARRGVRSILSIGLPDPDRSQAGINVYSFRQPALDGQAERSLTLFSRYAAVAIGNAAAFSEATERAEHLQIAMQSRAVIEQAKGILMARYGIDAVQAFDLLTEQSQTVNTKLRVLAEQIVAEAAR